MARFQSFWFGNALGPCEILCMKSFIDYGHEYDLYSYARLSVPSGVRLMNANEILPQDEVFFYRRGPGAGSVSAFTNMFRYRLLMLRGGWWVDTDVICLSPRMPEKEYFCEWQDELLINVAVLKFPEGHPFISALYERSRAAGKDIAWGHTGPNLITALAKEQGLEYYASPTGCAYPIHHRDALLPVTKAGRKASYDKIRGATFLHLWNEVFRRNQSVALHNPPSGSFLADLYEKHGVRRRFWAIIDPFTLRTWRHEARQWILGFGRS